MNRRTHNYTIVLVICAISFLFQFKTLNQFPQYIHSWAQCDRYALALGFIDNGGDLLHPQTYVMNNQFPGEFMIPRTTTITSVDFPIHDYVVSFIMRMAHSTEPWCFRLYILIYSMIGLYFLYRLVALFTPSLLKALWVLLFAMSSPVFLYYEAGFLPTLPSLSNVIIGLFFFFKCMKTEQRNYFYVAIFFIALAAMARLPFAIVLVAIGCFECYQALFKRRIHILKFLTLLIAVACIYTYYVYNNSLREKYGSLFLNYIIPASSWHEFIDFSKEAIKRWSFDYFNVVDYVLLVVSGIVFLYHLGKRHIKLDPLEKHFLFFIFILFSGCILYYLLMTYQFINHDYYLLDTFYLPVVFLFAFLIIKWPEPAEKPRFKRLGSAALIVFIPAFIMAKNRIKERTVLSVAVNERSTAESYKGAERFLDSLHVSKDAKLLMFCSDGSNNSFVLLKRKGFVVIEPTKEKIETVLKWPYDFIVVENSKMISSVYAAYPQIIHVLTKIGDNGSISLYKKRTEWKDITPNDFFELAKRKVLFDTLQTFESIHDSQTIRAANPQTTSNHFVGITDSVTEYGYTYKGKNLKAIRQQSTLLKVSFSVYAGKAAKEALLCLSLNANGKDLLFNARDISSCVKPGTWQPCEFLYAIPKVNSGDFELGLFIWNKGKNNLRYDDFHITIY